ncbi:YetF domain-containing protein [Micromonospora sp. NPDC047707]|uniref:YetF domain-containing protein n=1 Tax=Micromonospora sp. NPDC047707 TaxID=3154498 RepID=UPI0034551DED
MLRRNMRRELVTEEELYAKLREQGVDDIADAREVRMESDGEFSVITRCGQGGAGGRSRRRGAA